MSGRRSPRSWPARKSSFEENGPAQRDCGGCGAGGWCYGAVGIVQTSLRNNPQPRSGLFPMVDQRAHCFAGTGSRASSAEVALEHCWRRPGSSRESGFASGCLECVHLSARSARVSNLHVSPRSFHVASDRSPRVDSRPQHGANYRGRFLHRICRLAERPIATRFTLGDFLVSALGISD